MNREIFLVGILLANAALAVTAVIQRDRNLFIAYVLLSLCTS